MAMLHPTRDPDLAFEPEDLRGLAQQKVQAALAGLRHAPAADSDDADEADPLIQQAVQRMQANLGQLEAVDRAGRPVTWPQLARIVIGPLAARTRDADTVTALHVALAARDLAEPGPRLPETPPETGPLPDSLLAESLPAAPPLSAEPTLSPAAPEPDDSRLRVLRNRVVPPRLLPDRLRSSHRTLSDGVERYVFRHEDAPVPSAPPAPAGPPPTGEERLLAVLERRYPDPVAPPTRSGTPDLAEHYPQGVGWPS